MQRIVARNPDIEAALLSGDLGPSQLLVYADWLQAQGDPRGELISLQYARETATDPARARQLRALEEALHRAHDGLSEALVAHLRTKNRLRPLESLSWRLGFLRELHYEVNPYLDSIDAARAFFAHPAVAFLERLSLEFVFEEESPLNAAVKACLPPSLRELTLLGETGEHGLGPLLARLPRLRALTLHGNEYSLGERPLASLDTLTLISVDALSPDFSRALLPNLRRLILQGSNLQGFLERLRDCDLTPQLELLSLRGNISEEECDLLLTLPLRRLDVACLGMGAADRKRLAASTLACGWGIGTARRSERAVLLLDRPQSNDLVLRCARRVARMAGVRTLWLACAELELAGRRCTAVELRSRDPGSFPLGAFLEELARRAGLLPPEERFRILATALSETDWALKVVSYPERFPPVREGYVGRADVVRRAVDELLGVDPGEGVLEELLEALDCAPPVALLGAAPGVELREPAVCTLLTPLPAEVEDAEEEEQEEDEEEYDEFEEEEEGSDADHVEEEYLEPVALAPYEEAQEEEEIDDEISFDAADADAGEIWTEGPVEDEEDWVDPPPDRFPDRLNPEVQELVDDGDDTAERCQRCGVQVSPLLCADCEADLCEPCAGGRRALCAVCRPIRGSGPAPFPPAGRRPRV